MAYKSTLGALSDPTRRAVFERIVKAPRSVGEIAQGLPISRPAVSQHLKVLREAGLVQEERQGTQRIYSADAKARGGRRAHIRQQWQAGLGTMPGAPAGRGGRGRSGREGSASTAPTPRPWASCAPISIRCGRRRWANSRRPSANGRAGNDERDEQGSELRRAASGEDRYGALPAGHGVQALYRGPGGVVAAGDAPHRRRSADLRPRGP